MSVLLLGLGGAAAWLLLRAEPGPVAPASTVPEAGPAQRPRLEGSGPSELPDMRAGYEQAAPPAEPAIRRRKPPAPEVVTGHARRLAGRLTDEAGQPVAGAQLSVARPLGAGPVAWAGEALASTRSDAEGRFALEGLPAGVTLMLEVQASGFLAAAQQLPPAGGPLELRLARTRSVSGSVLDAVTGRPLAGLSVEASPAGAGSAPHPEGQPWGRAASRADGSFRIEGLGAGPYEVRAHARMLRELGPELERARAEPPADVNVEPLRRVEAGSEGVVLRLWTGYRIAGRVEDDRGRVYTGPLRLNLYGRTPDGRTNQRAHAVALRPEGEAFLIDALPAGRFDLSVETQGEGADARGLAPTWVYGVAAGEEGVVVRLARGSALRVRLTDAAGRALGAAQGFVYVEPEADAPGSPAGRYARREGDGWITEPLPTDRAYRLVAGGVPGFARRTLEGVRPGPEALSVVLEPASEVRGRVLLEGGEPAPAGVPVRAWTDAPEVDPASAEPAATALTDAQGRFTLSGVPPGRLLLVAGGTGSRLAPAGAVRGVLPSDPDVLLRVVEGFTISGRLVDARGAAVTAAELVARGATGAVLARHEDREGRFLVAGLARGRITLALRREGRLVDLGAYDVPATGLRVLVPDP